ncbi:MAG: hypothetical protein JRE81_17075 [Deltaproteobacteria bacterium]|jgi:hypothetical protein|nr:hypothetical protein [Deltaproteobacteria bacterium]
MPFTYDYVVIDPVSSQDLRDELRRHTSCDVGSPHGESDIRVLPSRSCFPAGVIEVHGQGVRFRLPEG